MKFIIQLLSLIILAFALELFLPWWSIAVAAFVCGYALKSKANFLAGLLGIAILWTAKALLIESSSATLTDRVAAMFSLNKPLLFLVTSLIGGLIGGFATLTGSLLKKEKRYRY